MSNGYRIRLKEPLALSRLTGKQFSVQIQWRGSHEKIRFAAGGDDALTSLTPGWMAVIEGDALVALDHVPAGAV